MPLPFRYVGTSCNLGRFGPINHGDVVELRIIEEESVAEDFDFQPIPYDDGGKVPLAGAEIFDLRQVDWSVKPLTRHLAINFTGILPVNMALAMVSIGCKLNVTPNTSRDDLLDEIARAAIHSEWNTLDRYARMDAPERASNVAALESLSAGPDKNKPYFVGEIPGATTPTWLAADGSHVTDIHAAEKFESEEAAAAFVIARIDATGESYVVTEHLDIDAPQRHSATETTEKQPDKVETSQEPQAPPAPRRSRKRN
jgi:hypothetical protein